MSHGGGSTDDGGCRIPRSCPFQCRWSSGSHVGGGVNDDPMLGDFLFYRIASVGGHKCFLYGD